MSKEDRKKGRLSAMDLDEKTINRMDRIKFIREIRTNPQLVITLMKEEEERLVKK